MVHLLGNEVEDLHAVHHLVRQRPTVGDDDGRVVLARLARRKRRLGLGIVVPLRGVVLETKVLVLGASRRAGVLRRSYSATVCLALIGVEGNCRLLRHALAQPLNALRLNIELLTGQLADRPDATEPLAACREQLRRDEALRAPPAARGG